MQSTDILHISIYLTLILASDNLFQTPVISSFERCFCFHFGFNESSYTDVQIIEGFGRNTIGFYFVLFTKLGKVIKYGPNQLFEPN